MARNLPWAKKDDTTSANGRPRKRQRVLKPKKEAHSDPDSGNENDRARSKKRARRTPGRSPSSSPPAPAIIEEYMQEGFDKDDIYMMVEDQFQTIAQSFTRHLHKAEYRRLTEEAKKKKASTIRNISRPINPGTVMSAEARKRVEVRELAERRAKGLKSMSAKARGKQKVEDLGDQVDEDGDEEEERPDDPWVGTSLHGLMASPRKSQLALVGLQGVRSNTRAAQGFDRNQTSPKKERRRDAMDVDLPVATKSRDRGVKVVDPTKKSPTQRLTRRIVNLEEIETDSDDDDDLDVVAVRHISYKAKAPLKEKKSPIQSSAPIRIKDEVKAQTFSKSRRKVWSDGFDDLPDDIPGVVDITKDWSTQRSQKDSEKRKERSTTVVPTFLV